MENFEQLLKEKDKKISYLTRELDRLQNLLLNNGINYGKLKDSVTYGELDTDYDEEGNYNV